MLSGRRPLRVAVVGGRHLPGLRGLLAAGRVGPSHVRLVCAVAAGASAEWLGECAAEGVPVIGHSLEQFCRDRGARLFHDFDARAEYDRRTVGVLEPFAPDLVVLSGYLYLLTRPMLEAYRHRLVNLHLSDLSVRDECGRPAFPGIHAVRDALAAGCATTAGTVHLVNDVPDGGAPLVRSWSFPVAPLVGDARRFEAIDMLKAYAYAHQQWMIRAAAGPLWQATLWLVASGAMNLDALGASEPSRVEPWTLDVRGRLSAPIGVRRSPVPLISTDAA